MMGVMVLRSSCVHSSLSPGADPELTHFIFVSKTPTRIGDIPYNERLNFEVRVHLPPSSSNDGPVYIPSLETDMPLFAHSLSDLQDAFYFGALSFKTSNMPVEAKVSTRQFKCMISDSELFFVIQAVFAETIDVQSTNGPIHGENHLDGPYEETMC